MTAKRVLLFGTVSVLTLPSMVFLFVALTSGLDPQTAVEALWLQAFARKMNLVVCGALGLVPIILLAVGHWIAKRRRVEESVRIVLVCGGLIPVLAVLVWANLEYWPRFLPSRTYPGFPHGLELIIGPGMFAPIGAAAGMVIAWVITKIVK